MPSETFLRLPSEKRLRILTAARQEFSQYPFESAQVTRICSLAKIPRVTFYSYFESLNDLYQYLFEELCDTDGENTEIDQCSESFENIDQQMQFFVNLVSSRQGVRKMALEIRNRPPPMRLSFHLCISLALQYESGILSLEELSNEYRELSALYEVS